MLLGADLLFILLHLLSLWPGGGPFAWSRGLWSPGYRFRIDAEGGIPELFGYLKLALIVALLILTARTYRYRTAAVWALVFGYVLLDDALSLHERYGTLLMRGLSLAPAYGLRAQDVGEVLVWSGVGVSLGALMVRAYRVGSPADRRYSRTLLALFCALVFFGGVIDTLHGTLLSGVLTALSSHEVVGAALPVAVSTAAATALTLNLAAPLTALALAPSAYFFGYVLSHVSSQMMSHTFPGTFAGTYAEGLTSLLAVGAADGLVDIVFRALLLDTAFIIVEDGGEMMVISFVLSYCLSSLGALQRRGGASRDF